MRESSFAGNVRLLFVTEKPKSLLLDCVVTESGPFGDPGDLVTLEIEHSPLSWVDLIVEELLATWADDERVLDLRLTVGGPARADIVSDGSRVRGHLVKLTAD